MLELLRANKYRRGVYIRPYIFQKGMVRELLQAQPGKATELIIDSWPFSSYRDMSQALHVCVSSWTRMAPNTFPAGAKIGFGPAGSTSDTYFPRMMETLGVNFERRNGGWSDLGGQLQDGLLDVIAFAAGVPVPAVSQLEVQTDVNIIEFTEAEQAAIIEAFPVSAFEIAADTYTTLEAPARSVSMWNFAIANCDLPETFVEAVVDVVMSDNERMVNIHKAATSTTPDNWDKNKVLKWHPGAAKWFKENAGADIPDSMIYGRSVDAVRRRQGEILGREAPCDADLVIGVPDSSNTSSLGYAQAAGLPDSHA